MSIKMRQKVEREIISAFVKQALAAGYRLSVSLERGFDLKVGDPMLGSTDADALIEEAMAGDDAHIFVHAADGPLRDEKTGSLVTVGWVYIVLGNDGWDVISDYSMGLDKLGLMAESERISKEYE